MKKQIIFAMCAATFLFSLQSCMDFDSPGDEITGNTEKGDDIIYHGQADMIDYHKEITQEGLGEALKILGSQLGQLLTAEFSMRGGKENGMPEAHAYQYQFNMSVDNYAGYLCVPHYDFPFAGITLPSTYAYVRDVNDGPNGNFILTKNYLCPLLNHPQIDSIPEIKAIGLLLYDYASQEVADLYGPFPYIDYKENKQTHPYTYNTVEVIYKTIVDNIDTINACFKSYEERPQWYKAEVSDILSRQDYITGMKSIENWRQFANSLKLRMAMHVVKRDKELAQKWAEEAVKEGVIDDLAYEVALTQAKGVENPLGTISRSWGDTRLNASFEGLLSALKHPYLDFMFDNNSVKLVNESTSATLDANSRVVGLRAGKNMGEGQDAKSNPDVGYSMLSATIIESPLYFMKLSEVDFLRAEGLVRGWQVGADGRDAKFYYDRGVTNASCEYREWGFDYADRLNDYMALENAVPYTYMDPCDDANNITTEITIGVKWNNGDSEETKLEKIITQKYIALFPYSFEAWTEMRRTGYPKLFPVLNPGDSGDNSLMYGDMLRRMRFPGIDSQSVQDDIQTSGLEALGGADTQSTRLWWDVVGVPNI